MIAIRQKSPDYCFVACVASALLDEGYAKLQDLIVARFPDQLQKPPPAKIGIPPEWLHAETVFKELGLAVKANFHQWPVQEAIDFLKNERRMARWIFINTKDHEQFHLVRVSEVRDHEVIVMDPSDGSFPHWSWSQFEAMYYALVVCDWK
jgi:hypothetical protein